jgi:hypothetical protein
MAFATALTTYSETRGFHTCRARAQRADIDIAVGQYRGDGARRDHRHRQVDRAAPDRQNQQRGDQGGPRFGEEQGLLADGLAATA